VTLIPCFAVKIKQQDYDDVPKRDFTDPRYAPSWQQFVRECRNGRREYSGAGVVIGPVSNGNRLYPQVHPNIKIPQYKFESAAQGKLNFAYVYPAWGTLEALP